MWLIADYAPTSLFSLKPTWATSSGGKSLLLPTPFAIKMALLDAICRTEGVESGRQIWPEVRRLKVAIHGPARIVVTNTLTRILKPRRLENADAAPPLQSTIGFREYVFHDGSIGIALEIHTTKTQEILVQGLLNINYLGKRGSLMQLVGPPEVIEALPEGFVIIAESETEAIPVSGIVHQLDDTGEEASFDKVNIYSEDNLRLGKERILKHIILPYTLTRSSKSYSYYERTE